MTFSHPVADRTVETDPLLLILDQLPMVVAAPLELRAERSEQAGLRLLVIQAFGNRQGRLEIFRAALQIIHPVGVADSQ